MTKLIELREKIRRFYGRHNRVISPVIKFTLALFTFLSINYYVGYESVLNHVYVALVLALFCAFLPMNGMIFAGAALICFHLYALAVEAAVTALMFFLMMFFLYFRFTPKDGYWVLLTPAAFICRIPYFIPVASGLLKGPVAVIPMIFGTMLHYFLQGIHNNITLLNGSAVEGETVNKFVVCVNQLLQNKEMYLVLAAFVLSMLIVYVLRRRAMEHAWSIATGAGILVEFVVICVGDLVLGISGKMLWLIAGTLISWGICIIIEMLFFNLDYSRTEKVQFEDDEYYYYVKAVPKINLSSREKQIKKIAGKKNGRAEGVTKKQLAKELDIEEDMLD